MEHVYTIRDTKRTYFLKESIDVIKDFIARNPNKSYLVDVWKRLPCCPNNDEYIGCFKSDLLS
jgi:outer membrane protein assembly factor BamD (BamD/ComL family)